MSPHNFGPVSLRDSVLYTSCRPGHPPGKADPISDEAVQEWIRFMKERGVSKVICLLDDNEYANYDSNLLQLYSDGGLEYLCQAMKSEGASANIINYVEEASSNGEKVVTHCTGGVGRAGRVAAGWLVRHYGLSPEQATEETLTVAKNDGINRKGDVEALSAWLGVLP